MINFLTENNFPIDYDVINKIYFDNSKWVSIKNIEESENETYDFSLYNNDSDFWCHSILYNGILGHQTPNGFDPIYYGIYEQAVRGDNDFHITELKWYKDPRYSKNLKWVKVKDIVHYMLNRELYNDEELSVSNVDPIKYDDFIKDGYKPYSAWFEGMAKKFKYDKRRISQELECHFLGFGDSVIPSDVRDNIIKNMVRESNEKYMNGTLWLWKEPIQGHRYIMGVDVSRGDSEDFSSINILDFDGERTSYGIYRKNSS